MKQTACGMLLHKQQELGSALCDDLEQWDGGAGEKLAREGTHVT